MAREKKHGEEYINGIKDVSLKIHDLKPDVVILTASQAINPGIVIKESLRVAYPSEKPPYFLFVDPRVFKAFAGSEVNRRFDWNASMYIQRKRIDDFMKAHFKNPEKARILVYDEFGDRGDKPEKDLIKIHSDSVWYVVRYLKEMPEYYIAKQRFYPRFRKEAESIPHDGGISPKHLGYADVWGFTGPPEAAGGGEKIIHRYGDLYKDLRYGMRCGTQEVGYLRRTVRGKRGIEALKYIKSIGREVGKEIREENEYKKSLEQKLTSIIAICSLSMSVLFSSLNFTGNVVGNFGISNWVGVIFFLIGLIGAVVWFRKR